MQRQPVGSRLDERQLPQPREYLMGVLRVDDGSQQDLRSAARDGSSGQRPALRGVGHGLQEPPKQSLDEVRREHDRVKGVTSADQVRQQRKPQRVPVREAEDPVVQGRVDARLPKKLGCRPGRGCAVTHDSESPAHAWSARQAAVGASRAAMTVSADAGSCARRWGPEPSIKRRHLLVCVDEKYEVAGTICRQGLSVTLGEGHLAERLEHAGG